MCVYVKSFYLPWDLHDPTPLSPCLLLDGLAVDEFELLGKATTSNLLEQCVAKCCQLGEGKCQYMWIVKKQCYAVACSPGSSACDPAEISDSDTLNSIYFPVTMTKHSSVGVATSPHGNDGDTGDSADSAPVSNAGSDVSITFPDKTSVILDGSLSSDDKVSSYCLHVRGGCGHMHVRHMCKGWPHACASHVEGVATCMYVPCAGHSTCMYVFVCMCRVWCTICGS